MPAITRTLTPGLVAPTVHKECTLTQLLETYREALREAVEKNADTMAAVNEIVTPYELPYQAKDALKSHVPRMVNVQDGTEVNEDHPVRLVNRAATFDQSEERSHEFCWQIPVPGRGSNFWIPLQINSDQYESWEQLTDGQLAAGEIRLLSQRDRWMLHVTVNRTVSKEAVDNPANRTKIGVDIGENNLLTGCALVIGSPTRPLICDGSRAKQLRKELFTTLRRLQRRDAAEWRIEQQRRQYNHALKDLIEKTSTRLVQYANELDRPLVVLEDLTRIRDRVDGDPSVNRRLHGWPFSRIQCRVEDKAMQKGIPVQSVSPAYTSMQCHECRQVGSRPDRGTFRCDNNQCWVSTYQADINAAVNIAHRVDPWGASCQLKPVGNDWPWDGSPVAGPRPT